MKTQRVGLSVVVLLLCLFFTVSISNAESINFLNSGTESLQGVDGDTSGWSSDDTVKNLKTFNWSLLGGQAALQSTGGKLGHKGSTGIGVWRSEKDEIGLFETAAVSFNTPYFLKSFELRSLFEDEFFCYDEIAGTKLYLGGNLVRTETFNGTGNGVLSVLYNNPYAIDKIEFYIPNKFPNKVFSEFALANLDVSMMPEPLSTSSFVLGSITMAIFNKKRKTNLV